MWPRSSIPRVISMFRKTPRRSSRSSPASRTSRNELTGPASLAIATTSQTVADALDRDVAALGFHVGADMAAGEVVVHEATGLHQRVDGRRADEAEAAAL